MSSYEASRGYTKPRETTFYDETNWMFPGYKKKTSYNSDARFPSPSYKERTGPRTGGYYPTEYDAAKYRNYSREEYRNNTTNTRTANTHEYPHKTYYHRSDYPSPNSRIIRRSDKPERSPWNTYPERRPTKEQYYESREFTRSDRERERDKRSERREYFTEEYANNRGGFCDRRLLTDSRGRKRKRSRERDDRSGRESRLSYSSSSSRSSSSATPSPLRENNIPTDRIKPYEHDDNEYRRHNPYHRYRTRLRSRTPPLVSPERLSPKSNDLTYKTQDHNFSTSEGLPVKEINYPPNDLRRDLMNSRNEFSRRDIYNDLRDTMDGYHPEPWRNSRPDNFVSKSHFHHRVMNTNDAVRDLRQTLNSSRLPDLRRPQSPLRKKPPDGMSLPYHSPQSRVPPLSKSQSDGKPHSRMRQQNLTISNLQNQSHWMPSHSSQTFLMMHQYRPHQVRPIPPYQKISSNHSPYNMSQHNYSGYHGLSRSPSHSPMDSPPSDSLPPNRDDELEDMIHLLS